MDLSTFIESAAPPRFACLMYHGLEDEARGDYTLSWRTFDSHLQWLRDEDYVIEGFGGLERRLASGDLPARYVVLTFDDGHRCFLRAAEMLKARGAAATFFLTRDFCRSRPTFLGECEIRELASTGELGTHGVTHAPLSHLEPAAARQELTDSKRWLEDLTGQEIRYCSAPGGFWNRSLQAYSLAAGYTLVGNSVEWWNEAGRLWRSREVNRIGLRNRFGALDFVKIVGRDWRFYFGRRLRSLIVAAPKRLLGRKLARRRATVERHKVPELHS